MHLPVFCVVITALGQAAPADPAGSFAGTWTLERGMSELAWLPFPPSEQFQVDVNGAAVKVSGAQGLPQAFTADGKTTRNSAGGLHFSTQTKWEGSALLINSLISGAQSYTLMERWKLSGSGRRLSIRRVIMRGAGESESNLVYTRDGSAAAEEATPVDAPPTAIVSGTRTAPPSPDAPPTPASTKPRQPQQYTVEAGTKLPLRMLSSITTKTAAEGDRVYLESAFPITVNGRIVIPAGSQVNATLTASKRAGKVKGKAELYLRFDTLILPNGTTRDFRARLTGAEPGSGQVDRAEGGIKGDSDKGEDVRKVGETTAVGAGVGSVVGAASGSPGLGAAVGAAAGAAAGLGRVFGSRGPDINLPKGSTVEMVLDRTLTFEAAELP